jgi:hypothetical protein
MKIALKNFLTRKFHLPRDTNIPPSGGNLIYILFIIYFVDFLITYQIVEIFFTTKKISNPTR